MEYVWSDTSVPFLEDRERQCLRADVHEGRADDLLALGEGDARCRDRGGDDIDRLDARAGDDFEQVLSSRCWFE